MNMKRLLTLVAFFATFHASAQQVNPVPDYVFANRMSAGRNTVTDTAAYFSIGPRYGATRGMMPPMVVDTSSFSANKRNGLLIFSVQKNKFLYWDSVGVKWAEMAGTGGSAIAGTGTTNYVPKFTGTTTIGNSQLFDNGSSIGFGTITPSLENSASVREFTITKTGQTANISTLNLQGDRSNDTTAITRVGTISGWQSTTEVARINLNRHGANNSGSIDWVTNNAGAGLTVKMRLNAAGELMVNSITDQGAYTLQNNGAFYNNGALINLGDITATASSFTPLTLRRNNAAATAGVVQAFQLKNSSDTYVDYAWIVSTITSPTAGSHSGHLSFYTASGGNVSERGRINSAGEWIIDASGTDAGDYKLQVSGNIYNTGSAVLAATSGNVGIGGTSPQAKLDVYGAFRVSSAAFNIPPSGAGIEYSFRPGDSTGYVLTFSRDYNTYRNQRYFALTHRFSTSNSELDALFINASQETLINTTTDAGDYKLQVSGNIYNTGSITTGAPSGGSIKPWKIGEAATVSPTSPNRTIRVEIDGVVYYLHAKTTND